jgi:hypothetical protein
MKKWFTRSVTTPEVADESWLPVYLATDVEPHIAELERAHHASVIALKGELIQAHQAIQRMTLEAMAMDEKIRSLMGG